MGAELNIPDDVREQMWEAIANVRDASPRVTNDADTEELVDAALSVVPLILAAELDGLAPGLYALADRRILHRRAADLRDGAR